MLLRLTLTVAVPDDADIDQVEPLLFAAGRRAMAQTLDLACQLVEPASPVKRSRRAETRGSWDGVDPRVLSTSFGRVVVARRRWRCRSCQRRRRPVDRLVQRRLSETTTAVPRVDDLNTAWERAHTSRSCAS